MTQTDTKEKADTPLSAMSGGMGVSLLLAAFRWTSTYPDPMSTDIKHKMRRRSDENETDEF